MAIRPLGPAALLLASLAGCGGGGAASAPPAADPAAAVEEGGSKTAAAKPGAPAQAPAPKIDPSLIPEPGTPIVRETYSYAGGSRDPFASVLDQPGIGPELADLDLVMLVYQERGNGSGTSVQPWGLAQSTTGFTVELQASHPQGIGRVKAQVQACPASVAFGNGSCTTVVTPSWVTVNGSTPEVVLAETFSGLTNHGLYHWRARILHAPKTGAVPTNPAHSPWRRLAAQSVEADIRLPEPALWLSLASGAALVAALERRRRRTIR